MNSKFLLPLAALSILTLAACDNKPAAPATPAATTQPATPAATPAAPAAAPTGAMTPEQAMAAIQAGAAQMTPEQKTATVAQARKAAEDAAKAQGLSADLIKQTGDMAESAAKQALGVQ
ncbi:MAG TPA: hypothetical protein VGM83_06180 [Devosiaceae bacterium]|jgi:hypothetical protein